MKNKYLFKFINNWKYIFLELSDEQAGILIKALMNYVETEAFEPEDSVLRVAFAAMKTELDYDIARQRHISHVRAEAGRKGGMKSGASRKNPAPKKTVNPQFTPPTVDEVKAYILSKNYDVDAEKFCAYNRTTGWKVGKKSMVNWKSAVDYWATRSKNRKQETEITDDQNEYLTSFKSTVI